MSQAAHKPAEHSRTALKNSPNEDMTGRDRMAWNVLCGWAGHLVYIVAGFLMPRMIDQHIGQAALGLWDFSWSIVHYFTLFEIGIGSSVNRHVAKYRVAGNKEALSCTVSSVMAVQVVVAFLILTIACAVAWFLPVILPQTDGQTVGTDLLTVRWVVILLGASLAVRMAFNAFQGVITGCHRWDLHNMLLSGSYAATVVGMMIVLWSGGGLRSLGCVTLGIALLTAPIRTLMAYRLCPELRISPAFARWTEVRKMLAFGGKANIEGLSSLILTQGSSIIIASYLGPAALAVYARPYALMRHVRTLVTKFSFVLVPTVSSLQGSGRQTELHELLIRSARYGAYLALPILLFVAILADPLLVLWMGPEYARGELVAILAIGYFVWISQRPTVSILVGMDLHGRAALVGLGLAMAGVGGAAAAVGLFGWGLIGAACSVAAALLGNGLFLVMYACRQFHISFFAYCKQVFLGPVLCAVPFSLCLLVARVQLGHQPIAAVGFGCVAGVLVLGPLYWRYMLSRLMRKKILDFASGQLGRLSVSRP